MFAARLLVLPRAAKIAIAVSVDFAVVMVALVAAESLVAGHWASTSPRDLLAGLIAAAIVPATSSLLGCYRSVMRYLDARTLATLAAASVVAAGAMLGIVAAKGALATEWNVAPIFALVSALFLISWRVIATRLLGNDHVSVSRGRKVAIYGAGNAGRQLALALRKSWASQPVVFIDDDRQLWDRVIEGLPVCPSSEIKALRSRGVEQVLLAMPSVSRNRRKHILKTIESAGMQVMVMPGMDEIASGKKRVDELRPVQLEDLLGRDPVVPIDRLLHQQIRGKVVMVTGAGGSIGSEVARQAQELGAKTLVLVDSCEYGLYRIDHELQSHARKACTVIPVLGNVCDASLMRETFHAHNVDTVYHSAAYKHVPLVEANCFAGVQNNVFGTHTCVHEALADGVQNFVLISTDKAVRPANVMGASKRVCELVVQAAARRYPGRNVAIVRFGNVLGSSGSVVPLFQKQIREGGPVTVTHPEVTRYFMTIPEAATLVIQAGAMGRNGEVFLLDMGAPVRIAKLAERMIQLSGCTALEKNDPHGNGDIEIRYTGLRPGEKLYEELLIGDNPEGTAHARIFKANEHGADADAVQQLMTDLQRALRWRNEVEVRNLLMQHVAGFKAEPANPERDLSEATAESAA